MIYGMTGPEDPRIPKRGGRRATILAIAYAVSVIGLCHAGSWIARKILPSGTARTDR